MTRRLKAKKATRHNSSTNAPHYSAKTNLRANLNKAAKPSKQQQTQTNSGIHKTVLSN